MSQQQCYYLGKTYPTEIVIDTSITKPNVNFDGKTFRFTSADGDVAALNVILKQFYTKAAKKFIEERLKFHQPSIKTKYKSFAIESHEAKWGTCNSQRHLTFHWKLILFPIEAIDYVVIHELCHLEHLNHDRSFWRLVGKLCPNYKAIMPILGTEKTRDM